MSKPLRVSDRMLRYGMLLAGIGEDDQMNVLDLGAGTSQRGLSSKKMNLITSNCGATRSLSIKWP